MAANRAETAARLGHELGETDLPFVLGRAAADTAAHLKQVSGTCRGAQSVAGELDAAFLAAVESEATVLPGALEFLDLLRDLDIPVALVSASPRPVVDAVLKLLGSERFRTTVAEGETPRTKPASDPYLAAARALGVDPAACLAVEDSPTGVASAEAAGCRVLAVASFTEIPAAARRTVLSDLRAMEPQILWTAGLRAG